MAHDPLHVLMIEPRFPGRLGHVADWLVRKRGYRCHFYANTVHARHLWPESVGQGLEVQTFGVGGVALESAVPWSRALERSLCYAYGCWEVVEQKRPRPIDLIVGRSAGLGSSLFAPIHYPAAPVVAFLDYHYHPSRNDLADEAGPETSAAYFHWRRSMAAISLLDLENSTAGWTATTWQRSLYPVEYRDDIVVIHDGVDTRRFAESRWHRSGEGRRTIAGRSISDSTVVISFVARTLDRLRGFDRFLAVAETLLSAHSDLLCVIVGDPIVQRGLDVEFHNQDYRAHLLSTRFAAIDASRLWFVGQTAPTVVAEVLAASDLHVAPSRQYPVARSLLEAMASGCVVLATDTEPHGEVILHGETGLLGTSSDNDGLVSMALEVVSDLGSFRPIGRAAAAMVRERFSQDACLPLVAERFLKLVEGQGSGP